MHFRYLCRKLKSVEFRQTSWARLSHFQLETLKGIIINYLKSPREGLNVSPMPFSGENDVVSLTIKKNDEPPCFIFDTFPLA